ncbi:MAG: YkgJ family cysteine cluster protein [Alphaproteobacteria bacterium]
METAESLSEASNLTAALSHTYDQVVRIVEEAVPRLLAETSASEAATALVLVRHDLAAAAAREIEVLVPPVRPAACHAGCGTCCHTRVTTDVATLAAIALFIRETFTPEAVAALRERLSQEIGRIDTVRPFPACPMLENDQCSVYPVRPLVCRGFTSFDETECMREHMGGPGGKITGNAVRWKTMKAVAKGSALALARAGLDATPVDLGRSLAAIMDTPDAAERWRAGAFLCPVNPGTP